MQPCRGRSHLNEVVFLPLCPLTFLPLFSVLTSKKTVFILGPKTLASTSMELPAATQPTVKSNFLEFQTAILFTDIGILYNQTNVRLPANEGNRVFGRNHHRNCTRQGEEAESWLSSNHEEMRYLKLLHINASVTASVQEFL